MSTNNGPSGYDFGKLEAKVDELLRGQQEAKEHREELVNRMTRLENGSAYRSGKAAAYGTIGGLLAGFLSHFAGRHIG